MSLITQQSKIVHKTSSIAGVVPTIYTGTTQDHTLSDWKDTDIYNAELFFNLADKKVFTRLNSSIVQIYPSLSGDAGTEDVRYFDDYAALSASTGTTNTINVVKADSKIYYWDADLDVFVQIISQSGNTYWNQILEGPVSSAAQIDLAINASHSYSASNPTHYTKLESDALPGNAGAKVDKVEGKGLSTNDFTTELLDMLTGYTASVQLYATVEDFPGTGIIDKIYIDKANNDLYYWNDDYTQYQTITKIITGGTFVENTIFFETNYGTTITVTGITADVAASYWTAGTGINSVQMIGNGSSHATGNLAVAMGISTTAAGDYSTATNSGTEANGMYSFAMGNKSVANGTGSVSAGNGQADGLYSFAMNARVNGDYSYAFSKNCTLQGDYSAVLGGTGLTGLTLDNMVYIPNLSIYYTPSAATAATKFLTRNETTGLVEEATVSTSDTYTTGGTYNTGTAIFTNNTGGTFSVTGFSTSSGSATEFTGGTVTGATIFTSSVTVTNLASFSANTLVEATTGGTLVQTGKMFISAYITAGGTAALLLENTANWDSYGNYIGTTITGCYLGQKHYNADYFFEAVANNTFIRMPRA